MAFIDYEDELNESGDLVVISHHKNKIYNILTYAFVDSPQLWIDLTLLVKTNTNPAVRTQALMDHLRDFSCQVNDYQLDYQLKDGELTIDIN
jgi:hypothetical protein